MLKKTIDYYFESLSSFIDQRIIFLDLTREQIADDPKRVSEIRNNKRDYSHPNLMGQAEIVYYIDLRRFNNKEDFLKKGFLAGGSEKATPYDWHNFLWGHLNFKKFFDILLDELYTMGDEKELAMLFRETLINDKEYAKTDYFLEKRFARIYLFPDEVSKLETEAIQNVHSDEDMRIFQKILYNKFSDFTLNKFNKRFLECVYEYLEIKKPNSQAIGLDINNALINLNKYKLEWMADEDVQYGLSNKRADLLEQYIDSQRNIINILYKLELND